VGLATKTVYQLAQVVQRRKSSQLFIVVVVVIDVVLGLNLYSSWEQATAGGQDIGLVSHVHTTKRMGHSLHSSSQQM